MQLIKDKEQLIKRLKALGWSLGTMVAVAVLDWLADNLGLFNLPNEVTVILGLILAQITKALNNYKQGKPMGFAVKK